jgi:small-conductance mechanosensitive channel
LTGCLRQWEDPEQLPERPPGLPYLRLLERAALSPIMRRSLWTALAALLAVGLASGASAQEAAGQEPSEATPAPAVVPVHEISARSIALADRVAEIESQRPTQVLEEFKARLERFEASAASAAERTESVLARRHTRAEVRDQATRLQVLEQTLARLRDEIDEQAGALDGTASELADETALWTRTLAQAREDRAPEAALREVRRALDALAAAERQVGADLTATLELQERLSRTERTLSPTLARLEAEQEKLAIYLLERQDEPVWRSIPGSDAIVALPGLIRAELSAVLAELVPYARDHRDAMLVHGIGFLLLAWFLARTREQRARRHPERAELDSDALRHPWAGALVIAVLLTPFIQPARVRAVSLVLVPAFLVAWLRILRGMLAPAPRGPLVGLVVLGLLDLLRAVLGGVLPLAGRGLLVLELGAGLAGIVWLRRPGRVALVPWRAAQGGPWLRLLSAWMRVLAPALAGGLFAALLGYTSLAECIVLIAIWGSAAGAAWMVLVRIFEAVTEQVIEQGGLARLRMVRTSRATLLSVARRVLRGIGVVGWLYATLNVAGLWSPAGAALGALLSASIGYGPVSFSLGGVLAFFLTLWISWLLARFTAFALDQEVFSRLRMPPGVPFALSTFTRYAILVVGFLVAMGAIGFSLDRVTLLLSAVGVGVGFGLQNVVNNFVSGAILLFERPIRVGDRVQLDDLFGIVSTIGIRASKVRTFDGSDVIVPNGDFISARVINWTLADRSRRVILPVGVAYGTKPRRVLELLGEVARSHPDVLADPEPVVLFRGFGDSSLNFELRVFTEMDWLAVMSDLAVATSEALEAAGITIPFPQRDLHLRNVDELRDALKEAVRADRDDTTSS